MNAHSNIQVTEIQQIERALDELLKVAVAARAPWPGRHNGPVSLRDLITEHLDATPAERTARALLDNPVGEAARQAITALGRRLNEIGGIGLMGDVLDRVAALQPTQEARREAVLDKRWNGIGGWAS